MPSLARLTAGDAVTVAPASCRKSPALRESCRAMRIGVSAVRSTTADELFGVDGTRSPDLAVIDRVVGDRPPAPAGIEPPTSASASAPFTALTTPPVVTPSPVPPSSPPSAPLVSSRVPPSSTDAPRSPRPPNVTARASSPSRRVPDDPAPVSTTPSAPCVSTTPSPSRRTRLPSQHPARILASDSFLARTCFSPSCADRCVATKAMLSRPPASSILTISPPLFPNVPRIPVAWYPTRVSVMRSTTSSRANTMSRICSSTAVCTGRYPGPTAALTRSNQ
mmetsp:Transcript_2193/g.8355  ORF Transcript_2193/g.8355 Transcript_2193/m.8355 type:complete len:279 (-) Transcript_2193:71-907(-)